MFRACNEFCTVLSCTFLNTFTLQTCFCLSARLYLIVSHHCSVQFIPSSRLFDRTPKELFFFFCYFRLANNANGCFGCLCCSFWTSSSMNADLNVFNTCLYIHLCIYQTLLSKATYSAFMLYIFLSVHVHQDFLTINGAALMWTLQNVLRGYRHFLARPVGSRENSCHEISSHP